MEITICIGSSCHLRGSRDVIQILERLVSFHGLQDQVTLKGSFCMGECLGGVCVKIGDQKYALTPSSTEAFFEKQVLEVLKK